ncbi:MAG: hypothetical protein R3180_04300, partial [Marinobacter sp.]|nr:hypothetical protein [Marinobacter sp.]
FANTPYTHPWGLGIAILGNARFAKRLPDDRPERWCSPIKRHLDMISFSEERSYGSFNRRQMA